MARVVWRIEALNDLDDIADYIDRFDPTAADGVKAKLRRCGNSLSDFPERGRLTDHGRRQMATVPPYVLTYEVEADTVTILSIRHGARRPLD